MPVELPDIVAEYFASDRGRDPDAVAHRFMDDATVKDEGSVYQRRSAIRDWIAGASTQYSYSVEPIFLEALDDWTIVTSHLVGNIPGSPLDLRNRLNLAGEKIAELEIAE